MVLAKGRGPWRFWWISFLSRDHADDFFLGGFSRSVGSATTWSLFRVSFLLPFHGLQILGFGFLKFGFWMLEFCGFL